MNEVTHGFVLGDHAIFQRFAYGEYRATEGLVTGVSDRFLRVQYRTWLGLRQNWISVYYNDDPKHKMLVSKVTQ